MTIFYYFYDNNQGENKPQNSPNLESATFDYPWMVQLTANSVQFTGQRQKAQ